MKLLLINAYVLIFIGWLTAGCNNSSSNEAKPQSGCRVQKYVAVSKSVFYDRTDQTTYDYDAQGNLSKTAMTTDERPANGATSNQTSSKSVTYTYDISGFLTVSASQELYNTIINKVLKQQQITRTVRYSYASGRLSGFEATQIGLYGVTKNTVASFAYDASSDLVSKTETNSNVIHDPKIVREITVNSTGPARVWTYQKNQLIDYMEKSGTSEWHPFTIQNGVITKMGDANYELRFEYDTQQRVINEEHFVEGRLNEYYRQSWSDAKPLSAALPVFKGFPAIAQVSDSDQPGVSATQKTFFWNSVSKTMYQFSERTSAIQANAQGFIVGAFITTKHYPIASSQDLAITETYTYTGCQ